jgi:DNA-binding transcriptional LysR family regulator
MLTHREALSPASLHVLATVAAQGSFAGAARVLGLVPSALTYRIRQIEDALDVLLFDRSTRQARPTAAGLALLHEGERLLGDVDALALRVKRVATGWEAQLTIALDSIISRATVMDLCEAFLALQAPTRIKLLDEALSGTLEALTSGRADLALGAVVEPSQAAGLNARNLGMVPFVYAVAPHHPLAKAPEPLTDELIVQHRAIAVADSTPRTGTDVTIGLLKGQEVLTVPTLALKVQAQVRGLGCGFLPEPMVLAELAAGRLATKRVQRPVRRTTVCAAWRAAGSLTGAGTGQGAGRALSWWLAQFESPATRRALLSRY